MGTLYLEEQAAPGTPSANKIVLYAKSDGRLYWKDDAGAETEVGGGGTLGTPQATTSGTTKDFIIPSWAKKVTVMLSGVSLDGTETPIIQLGAAGGIETTGYSGSAAKVDGSPAAANLSSGFALTSTPGTGVTYNGAVVLTLMNSSTNTWTAHGVMGLSDQTEATLVGGVKSLTGVLTTVRLTSTGTPDDFDAGSANVLIE